VAFDRDGARLGFGAGYYDRLLSRKSLQDTLLVGLAYSFQIVPELPTEAWDRPVHLIITEDEVIEVAP
jgi:5-formyltetrahydrofolate cyclo-ligase